MPERRSLMKYTKEDILRIADEENVSFIRLQFTDILGSLKNVAITRSQLEKALNNKCMFDGSSIEGFVRIEESDMYLHPDLDTFVIFPWRTSEDHKVARLICDVYCSDGTPFEGDPRYVLRRAIKKAADMGYSCNVGPECEFFLFHIDENGKPTTQTHDQGGYFDLGPVDRGENCRRDICLALEEMGFEIEASHHEVAEAQHEIDFKYDEVLTAADNVMTFKYYQGSGQSVMEMSHRSKVYDNIIKEAEKDLRDLLNIPDNYKVLFLQGGASQFFAEVPMNLMKNKKAGYILTGQWAKKAFAEAKIYGEAVELASSADKTFSYIPDCSDLDIPEDLDYVYICENNTIYGTKYKTLPNTKGHILVSDVSSCFLSEPMDVTKYGVVYGGVQKNIGPAGVVIAIIREDLITDDVLPGTPTMLKWKTQADADSLYNTPPCYNIYICGKVFKWIKKMGGLSAMKEHNEKKAKILYDFLDESKLFMGTVVKEDRSLMNVPFVCNIEDKEAKDAMEAKFIKEAAAAGFVNLKGHRTVGGMRASIYNAMPIEGVEKLVEFMKKFEKENA